MTTFSAYLHHSVAPKLPFCPSIHLDHHALRQQPPRGSITTRIRVQCISNLATLDLACHASIVRNGKRYHAKQPWYHQPFQAPYPPTLNSCNPGGRQDSGVSRMSPSPQLRRTPLLVSQQPRASVWPTTAMRSPNPTRLWGTTISTDVVTGLSTAALQTEVATACETEQSESTCFSEVPSPASSKSTGVGAKRNAREVQHFRALSLFSHVSRSR